MNTPQGTRTSSFRKANRAYTFLKIGIEGPSGAGKTMGALLIAKGLATSLDNIALVDTENGSGELYADDPRVGYTYMYARMEPPFTPAKYVQLIKECVEAGVEVLVLDSLSHAWKYILSYKETLDSRGGNSYANWGKAKPIYDELKNAILFSPLHIIACMRSKAEYSVQTNAAGKSEVKKLGVNPIAEPENEYEFTCVFTVDKEHMATTLMTGKDRTGLFGDDPSFRISDDTGKLLRTWLSSAGAPIVPAEWSGVLAAGTAASQQAEADMSKPAPNVPTSRPANGISPEGQRLIELMPNETDRRDFKQALVALSIDWKAVVMNGGENESPDDFRERVKLLLSGATQQGGEHKAAAKPEGSTAQAEGGQQQAPETEGKARRGKKAA